MIHLDQRTTVKYLTYFPFLQAVTIGLGPDGELRYPSTHGAANPRKPIGVGEFQCYDKYMLDNLKQYAEEKGNPLWGLGGPHDAPTYDQPPCVDTFFKDQGGSWESPYGVFFLEWYSNQLVSHGHRILSLASSVFRYVFNHITSISFCYKYIGYCVVAPDYLPLRTHGWAQ